jgi:hypothetical protein
MRNWSIILPVSLNLQLVESVLKLSLTSQSNETLPLELSTHYLTLMLLLEKYMMLSSKRLILPLTKEALVTRSITKEDSLPILPRG